MSCSEAAAQVDKDKKTRPRPFFFQKKKKSSAPPPPPPNPVATIAGVFSKKKKSDKEPVPSAVPAWRTAAGNLAAGATAGMAVEAALYPIDTIKTRLQLAASGGGLRALLASGGGRALYAGVWGNLAGVAPASAIFMGVYEPTKKLVSRKAREAAQKTGDGRDVDRFEFLGPLVAGAAAGLASSAVRVPTEVVKQRLQAGQFGGRSAVAAVRGILAREGLRGMFAGYGSFLLRDLPFDAIEFVAYEQLKSAYERTLRLRPAGPGGGPRRETANAAEVSAIGAAAGALTGVVTTPLDVLKTRLMTQGTVGGKYSGVVDCARQIARDEGAGALFRGWEPRVLWIGLGGCVFFSALEAAKRAYAPDEEAWAAAAAAAAKERK